MHVISAHFKCFIYFRDMLQLFHMDVAKLDRDVAYIASVCRQCFNCFLDVCCKCVYLDVAYVSHLCCKCFIWMLRKCFSSVLDARFKCFICHFCMLQMLHMVVSKVYRVFHMG
jgi:hypothetical protein